MDWMELALSKTEIVMLTKQSLHIVTPMWLGSEVIQSRHATKYLVVIA